LFGTDLLGWSLGVSVVATLCHLGAFLLPGSPISCFLAIPAVLGSCASIIPLSILELIITVGSPCVLILNLCTAPGCCGCGPCFAGIYDICGIGIILGGAISGLSLLISGTLTTLAGAVPYLFQLLCFSSVLAACSEDITAISNSQSFTQVIEIAPTLVCT
jgi:hypothetical protein